MKIKKSQLNEATLGDEIKKDVAKADVILDDPTVVVGKDQIKDALDRAYTIAKRKQRNGDTSNFPNVLFIGEGGTGKTGRIVSWAREKGVNLVKVLASVMDDTDLGGAISPNSADSAVVQRLASTEMDELGTEPDSVLFLDEFNRAPKSVRGSLLTLIQDHTIRDDRVKGKARFLPNFLFTVAAINPSNMNYNTDELDDAEMSRFRVEYVYGDPRVTLNYMVKKFNNEIANAYDDEEKLEATRKLELSKKLLSNNNFKFDSADDIEKSKDNGNGLILTARTLDNLLDYCDGTKQDFLVNWDNYCNSLKKKMAQSILANYEDVNLNDFEVKDDKANDVLKGEVFKKAEKKYSDKLRDFYNS